MNDLTFDNPNGVEFTVERETRTIRGLALPYGDSATSNGMRWSFAKGALRWGKVKLLNAHDWTQVLGIAELEDTDEGLVMTAKVAPTRLGDEVLALAEMGAIDGLSIGLGDDVKATARGGVQHVQSGTVREVSTTPIPAFERAAIRSVAASAAQMKENKMDENETKEVESPQVVSLSADDVRTIFAEEIAKANEVKRPVVPAGRPDGPVFVREEPMYRFGGAIPGKFDFAKDVTSAVHGDREAHDRVMKFMGEHLLSPAGLVRFTEPQIDTEDTAAVNPARYRPDMFLDEGPAQPTPLYSFFYKGGLSDVTPFFYSKLDSYSGLLDDHDEGVEPTAGTFVTESGATVTPSPISGKVHITREVHDQGGSPQVSGLVWSKFQRVFRQMLETKTATLLANGTYDSFATVEAGATGEVLGAAIEDGVVDLQFKADGARFQKMFGHVEMYKALRSAVDGMDRPLYPIVNPSNAQGSAGNLFGYINVAGMRVEPTWSLGATGAGQTSYAADPNAVHVWNSGLTKLERLNESVEGYDIGAWAYFAGIVYDETGVLELGYDSGAGSA